MECYRDLLDRRISKYISENIVKVAQIFCVLIGITAIGYWPMEVRRPNGEED